MDIIANLDIFFTLLVALVYIAFVFYTKTIDSKFMVFFISCFINIFNYSIIIKNEINFLSIVTLNIFFILSMVFFYIYLDPNSNLLSSDYIENSDIKNILTIIIFVFSFILISFIFFSLSSNRERLYINQLNNNILTDKNYYYKNKDDLKQEKLYINTKEKTYIVYNKNISFIENNGFFKHYNLIILFYIIMLISFFIINNMRQK